MSKRRTDLINPNYGMVIHRDFVPLYADDNYAQFFGFQSGKDILELSSIFSLVNPDQRDITRSNYDAIMSGKTKPQVRSFRHFDKHNTEFFILAIEQIVDWKGEPALQIAFVDISSLTQAETKIRKSEQRFRDLIEGSIQGMVIHRNFKPLMVNQAYASMHGYESPEAILALDDISVFFTDENVDIPLARASLILSGKQPDPKQRFKNKRKDGSFLWVELVERKVIWNNQDAIQTTLVDVTEHVILEEKLILMAMTDSLTNLYNRRFLMDKSSELFLLNRLKQQPLACILIDLDKFKDVNDEHGHSVGDETLIEFSKRCQNLVKEPNYIGRYGGEEFLVVMPNTGSKLAYDLAEKIRINCATEPLLTSAGAFTLTVSVGVSYLKDTDSHFDQLIDRADERLYEAKALGRNRVVV
jgi:diguanylate cyclase (GGDEF)-like protein/PAS domain S-box-containing protein